MSVLHTILWFLVAIGILVVVHEFGHYLAARLAGVKVLRFSVGFGKPLVSRRFGRDRTEWTLSALPFGGYVKMLDEREGEVPAAEAHRSFNRATVWRRIGIVSAGPIANFLLAIVFYWALLVHGLPALKPLIGEPPAGTPAAQAGSRWNWPTAAACGSMRSRWTPKIWSATPCGRWASCVTIPRSSRSSARCCPTALPPARVCSLTTV